MPHRLPVTGSKQAETRLLPDCASDHTRRARHLDKPGRARAEAPGPTTVPDTLSIPTEGPHACQGADRLQPPGLGGDDPDATAHLSGPDQAARSLSARPGRPLPLRRRAPARRRLPPPGSGPRWPAGPRRRLRGRPHGELAAGERLAGHLDRERRLRSPRRRAASRARRSPVLVAGAAAWAAAEPGPGRDRLGHRRWGERLGVPAAGPRLGPPDP